MNFLVIFREKQPYKLKKRRGEGADFYLEIVPNFQFKRGVIVEANDIKHAFMKFQNIVNRDKVYEVEDIDSYGYMNFAFSGSIP